MNVSRTYSAQIQGVEAHIVTIEVDISHGLHAFSIVGLGDKSIEESKDRISAAIKNSGFISPKQKNQKVVISLAPACMKKGGSSFDLAMAIAYLKTAGEINFDSEKIIFLGELSLDGKISRVSGVLAMLQAAQKAKFLKVYIPLTNTNEAGLIQGIEIYPVSSIRECIDHLENKIEIAKIDTNFSLENLEINESENENDFIKIHGQEQAKRALEIAAAGRHNIILYGPPGTGKTTLARSFSSIIPNLSQNEIIEVINIHSITKGSVATPSRRPPFRSPHHSSSSISILGGGNMMQPGEITLAHRGILFMDEFPEFERKTIECLRQPLEEKNISVSRANGTVTYPSDFILVGTMNPCPCGYQYSDSKTRKCICTDFEKTKYHKKISGPIADRIDLWVSLSKIDYEKITNTKGTLCNESSIIIKKRVYEARSFKEKNENSTTYRKLDHATEEKLTAFANKYEISNRAYIKTINIARTIANLAQSTEIKLEHLLEALQFKQKQF